MKQDLNVNCRQCKEVTVINVDPADIDKWQQGELIQRAMPYVSVGHRELLISGICESCFNIMFAKDEEVEDEPEIDVEPEPELEVEHEVIENNGEEEEEEEEESESEE